MTKATLPLGARVLLVPVGLLVALILVLVIALRVGLAQVMARRANLASLQKNAAVLRQKRDLLTNIALEVVPQTSLAATALPGKNPALAAISQIKSLAAANGVALTGLKVSAGGEAKAKVSGVEISFDSAGPAGSILSLISEIKRIAPITHVAKVELNLTGTEVQATVRVTAYWAPFPTKLPALSESISALNEAEKKILENLAGLTQPGFVTLTPSGPAENPNPFGE